MLIIKIFIVIKKSYNFFLWTDNRFEIYSQKTKTAATTLPFISRIEKGQHKIVTPATTLSFIRKIRKFQKALNKVLKDVTPYQEMLTRQLLECNVCLYWCREKAKDKLAAASEVAAKMLSKQQLLR